MNTQAIKPSAERCVAAFGCTMDQAKRMLAKNAEGFRWMAARAARAKNGRYNGYSEAELRTSAADYEQAAK